MRLGAGRAQQYRNSDSRDQTWTKPKAGPPPPPAVAMCVSVPCCGGFGGSRSKRDVDLITSFWVPVQRSHLRNGKYRPSYYLGEREVGPDWGRSDSSAPSCRMTMGAPLSTTIFANWQRSSGCNAAREVGLNFITGYGHMGFKRH